MHFYDVTLFFCNVFLLSSDGILQWHDAVSIFSIVTSLCPDVALHFRLVSLYFCDMIPHSCLVNFYSRMTKPFGDFSFSKTDADFDYSLENLEKYSCIKHPA